MIPIQIVEMDIERDRKTCISLDARVTGANRELAQWLLDHDRYSAPIVANWLGCGETRIKGLRRWAEGGFVDLPHSRSKRRPVADGALKSQENSDSDTEDGEEPENEGGTDVASPEEIKQNIFDSIARHMAIVRAYKKVLAVSALDEASKNEVSVQIGRLITKWQSLQRALAPRREDA